MTSFTVDRILMALIVAVLVSIVMLERHFLFDPEKMKLLDRLDIVKLVVMSGCLVVRRWVVVENLMHCMLMEMNWLNIMLVIKAMVKGMVCLVVLAITLLVMIRCV